MRAYKFRAWNGAHILSWDWLCDMGQVGSQFFNKNLPDRSYEVMQYTGLKDKNGKEIYEGDIVRKHGDIYQVTWSDKSCGFKAIDRDDYEMFLPSFAPETIEVIGNIYENPELLT